MEQRSRDEVAEEGLLTGLCPWSSIPTWKLSSLLWVLRRAAVTVVANELVIKVIDIPDVRVR